jgi:hypothetical protein
VGLALVARTLVALLAIAIATAGCSTIVEDSPTLNGTIEPGFASAITGPPVDMAGINSEHARFEIESSNTNLIRFGTHADPAVVTLGPTDGGSPGYPAYGGKLSMNIKMPHGTPVLAPFDLRLIGFNNRSARARGSSADGSRQEPFDDLELCFESLSADWPGMIMCVYHLHTSPLLAGHPTDTRCEIAALWEDQSGVASGRQFYLADEQELDQELASACDARVGAGLGRGRVLGYSGTVGENPHVAFNFKVPASVANPLTVSGDPNLHWVQPARFFYWRCHEDDVRFQPGVIAYPVACGGYQVAEYQQDTSFKY